KDIKTRTEIVISSGPPEFHNRSAEDNGPHHSQKYAIDRPIDVSHNDRRVSPSDQKKYADVIHDAPIILPFTLRSEMINGGRRIGQNNSREIRSQRPEMNSIFIAFRCPV